MVRFQQERIVDVRHEAMPLLLRHWKEIALNKDAIPLDPNWEAYEKLEEIGAASYHDRTKP